LVLALLLGGLGAHRFYLRQWGWGIAYVLFSWTFIPIVVSLVECFLIRKRTEKYNEQVARQIILKMKIIFSEPGAGNAAVEVGLSPHDGARLAAGFRDERECPYCAERILKKARVCKHCGHDVEPLVKADTASQTPPLAPPEPTKADGELSAAARRVAEYEAGEGMRGKPAAAAGRPPALGKSDTPAQTPPPAPPQSITEAPTVKPQASTPAGGVPFSGAAASRPPVMARSPQFRMISEPSGNKMKFVAIAVVALILVGAGVWYFSQHRSKVETMVNPKDGLKYVWIPPGTFMMGCSPGDNECSPNENPLHQVTITRGFWIGQTLTTAGAFKRFAKATGRSMPGEPHFNGRALNPGWGNDAMPVVDVDWGKSQAYCGWLGGRLPTEAEWEYAARGGSTGARYGPLDEVAWYASNSGLQRLDSFAIAMQGQEVFIQRMADNENTMHEVGSKQPNGFGLYDMLGNVWEWVSDWYDEYNFPGTPSQNPQGPASGKDRIMRGGSWLDAPNGNRVSVRVKVDPTQRTSGIGFRCGGEVFGP